MPVATIAGETGSAGPAVGRRWAGGWPSAWGRTWWTAR